MLGLDTETTGRQPKRDRVLSVGIVTADNIEHKWYLQTVEEIPAEVTRLHKIDMEKLVKEGIGPVEGFTEIATIIDKAIAERQIVVAFNASFDLTLLYREFDYYQVPQPDWRNIHLVDPFLMHMLYDKTSMQRSLGALMAEYELPPFDEHDALADAQAARDVAVEIGARYPKKVKESPYYLTSMQRSKRHEVMAQWKKGLGRAYERDVDGWPIKVIPDPIPNRPDPSTNPPRTGKPWTDEEHAQLRGEVAQGLDWDAIGAVHERRGLAVWSQAHEKGLIPYGSPPPGEY
ncbi:exonuclease domain-containing protein [Mycobacteroides abscessus]|nr:exonuclease domain-containing protein [Mycobacteroides abscessus]MDO3336460.1 exonuclease domain-containing protein [Mycobacteroides abscessus subsp. bolletii]